MGQVRLLFSWFLFVIVVWKIDRQARAKEGGLQNINIFSFQHLSITMSASKSRTIILTGGVAAITAMGAWYGATLKTDREFRQVCMRMSSSLSPNISHHVY
jgi:hypothetical protein